MKALKYLSFGVLCASIIVAVVVIITLTLTCVYSNFGPYPTGFLVITIIASSIGLDAYLSGIFEDEE